MASSPGSPPDAMPYQTGGNPLDPSSGTGRGPLDQAARSYASGYNRPTISGPTSGVNWTIDHYGPNGEPVYRQNTILSPGEGSLLQQTLAKQNIGTNAAGNVIAGQYNNAPNIGGVQSGLMGQQMKLYSEAVQPQNDRMMQQLRTQLATAGLTGGSSGDGKAAQNAMESLEQAQVSGYAGAAVNAMNSANDIATKQAMLPMQLAEGLTQVGNPNALTAPNAWASPDNGLMQPVPAGTLIDQTFQDQMAAYNSRVQASNMQNAGFMGMLEPFGGLLSGNSGGGILGGGLSAFMGA
jgi:hypothetical protein